MSRVGTESSRTTLFQLEALTSAVAHGGFSAAATELGVRDKHRLIKAVERLAENLKLEGLSDRVGDELVLPIQLQDLEPSASNVLAAIQDFERVVASLNSKTAVVRCVTYPSLVTTFLASAVASFEEESGGTLHNRVQFVSLDSRNRRQSGAVLMRSLQAKFADVALGQTNSHGSNDPNLGVERLFSWNIVAAVHDSHPLRGKVEDMGGLQVIDIAELSSFPVLVSPLGHRSRDLLMEHEPSRGFNIELETDNSQARAALGQSGLRVPLIASDSLADNDFDTRWPVVGVKRAKTWKVLGDSHSVYWRKDLPEFAVSAVSSFVRCAIDAAGVMRTRPGGALF